MIDPRQIAVRLLGAIDWQSEVSGFCPCPGAALHTSRTGTKDCRVNIDGAPTVFCFHASCIAMVAEVNHRLRREIGASPWEITLPDGAALRSGDVLQSDGTVKPREEIQRGTGNAEGETETLVLETVRTMAERFRPELLDVFRWPVEDILR